MTLKYGDKRDYRKIDIFVKNVNSGFFDYVCNTTWSKTLKQAKEIYCKKTNTEEKNVSCKFYR